MEQNSVLWWAMMKLWAYSAISCFLAASFIGLLLANLSADHAGLVSAVVAGTLFLPLLVIAFHGFRNRYFMGHRFGFIYRGFVAQAMAALSIGIYFIAVGWAYVSWR